MKVALVHDWLTGMRGGEKCLESLCRLYPGAHIHTLFQVPGAVSEIIDRHPVVCSYLQTLPHLRRYYRALLPLFPSAIERFDLSPFDLVISSSHCVAKGVRTRSDALHICYCHTPMRYVYDLREAYFSGKFSRRAIGPLLARLKRWDKGTAHRVDRFIANSQHIRDRIKRSYGREADVVYPPVETDRFGISGHPGEYYLIVSALVPYKRVDLVVDAFNRLGLPLLIVGDGPERKRLKARSRPNINFLNWQQDDKLPDIYSKALAFVLPGVEDFGITSLESQAAGRPVIALREGGAVESVIDRETGRFFWPQTVDALIEAINQFEPSDFNPERLRENALHFDRRVFERRIKKVIESAWKEHRSKINVKPFDTAAPPLTQDMRES